MLGLELDETRASAVGIDEQGTVRARAQMDADGDLGAAAAGVLDQIRGAMAGSDAGLLGVAAINPESAAIAPVVSQLALRFGASFNQNGAVQSGTAAAAAEAWVGAARGV